MRPRNIRLLIAYDGSGYSGWQRQQNAPTIQGTIEDRLAVMTTSGITLHGAGRTDAGVHATGMVANFVTTSSIPCAGFMDGLNSMLPKDIRILDVDEMEKDFHSRYNAAGKTYSYTFFTGAVLLPTERLYTAHFRGGLDETMVEQALKHIRGTQDFTSFEAAGSRDVNIPGGRGAVRTLFQATLSRSPAKTDTWVFSFTGDGFLRHMVRNLVGTLMEVGSGRMSSAEFKTVLHSCNRDNAGPTAPSCGLVLNMVHYKPFQAER
ncbi:MAG: tRNA pseudouridine(38-40) synthase TruA [Desulfobulbaceae bacterium]|nr:tRNA pseudouridine(38-40) synthase TruA [Desulfobulbaceae bacterium]